MPIAQRVDGGFVVDGFLWNVLVVKDDVAMQGHLKVVTRASLMFKARNLRYISPGTSVGYTRNLWQRR